MIAIFFKDYRAKRMNGFEVDFWRSKPLDELSLEEWEALCDGCGKCCLIKLEDDHSGEIYSTDISCKLLDLTTCRCASYEKRTQVVEDCYKLTPFNIDDLDWLPESCSYRMVARGEDLPFWHHLVSGSRSDIHRLGHSIKNWAVSESDGYGGNALDRIIQWVD